MSSVTLFTDADVLAGTERHILELGRALRELGVDARLACPCPSPLAQQAVAASIPLTPISKGGWLDRAAVGCMRGLLSSHQTQIIHAHNGRTAFLGALALRRAPGRLVVTQHFIEPAHLSRAGLPGALSRAAHRWVDGRCDHVIAVSGPVLDAAMARAEARPEYSSVIPNGIAEPPADNLMPRSELRDHLGVAPDAPLVLCLARLEKEKDLPTLIDAMQSVCAAHPAARCLIGGEGSQRMALADQIHRLNLDGLVRLLGFRTDALALIRACDLLVLPSRAEPFGLVLVEAMALSKAVVAVRAAGPLQIVVDRETGLLVPPFNTTALAEAINHLIADPAERGRMADLGRQRYRSLFTAQRMAQQTAAVYQRVLAAPRRGTKSAT